MASLFLHSSSKRQHSHGKSSSSKQGSHNESRSSKSSHSAKSGSSSKSSQAGNVSFLFVVNELPLNQDFPTSADHWGNNTPPEHWHGFVPERSGSVLRYMNGMVARAEECYLWYRPDHGEEGAIGYWDDNGPNELGHPQLEFAPLETYSTTTVFACGPFLPFVHGDGDVTIEDGDFSGWCALHFQHDGAVSRASSSGGCKVLAGRNAGFIDTLLPRIYRNTNAAVPHSRGLGGELGLVIGLMALSQQASTQPAQGPFDYALEHYWRGNQWSGQRHVGAWPAVTDDPRGVLVHIALESQGLVGQTAADIENFEWHSIAVTG